MMQNTRFVYRALDTAGAQRRGTVDAADQRAAINALLSQGLTPLDTRPEVSAGRLGKRSKAPVKATDRQFFFTELGTLLGSGISLSEALSSMARAYSRLPLGPSVTTISADVNAGKKLSDSIAAPLANIPRYAIAMIRAGEASGQLAEAFAAVSTQLEYDRKVAQEFRNALTYPVILVSAGILALTVVFIGVVPRFASLLSSRASDIPIFSRWVIEAGMWAEQHKLFIGLGAFAVVLIAGAIFRNPGSRLRVREVASKLPVIGPWLVRVNVARWLTVLSALLKNRIPVVMAMSLSAEALDLGSLRKSVDAIGAELQRGSSLSECLNARGWFPETRTNLIWVGERSGQLPAMLATLGGLETDMARETQKKVLALIEPAAILSIGLAIGLVMVAIMMAITSMNSMVG